MRMMLDAVAAAKAPEVTAARIGAVASIAAALLALLATLLGIWANFRIRALSDQVQLKIAGIARETELTLGALGHLRGGSQERAGGIAALKVLKRTTDQSRWDKEYDEAVRGILTAQLIYVLTRGRNRWEAHEIANVEAIASWFRQSDRERLMFGEQDAEVTSAAHRYKSDWVAMSQGKQDGYDFGNDGGRSNKRAIESLITKLDRWFA